MSIINLKEKTINAKIVYYGTALGGKTTSLKYVHRVIDPEQKIELVSLNTDKDRTLFFDFLPISVGRIGDYTVRFQGFTVPGQVKYNLTRKYVLTGADAVVLVVDSQRSQLESNIAALQNLKENLAANGLDYDSIPLVLQYNKRDLPQQVSVAELQGILNDREITAFETVATEGRGVFEAFIEISKQMMDHIAGQYRIASRDESFGDLLERNLMRLLKRRNEDHPLAEADPGELLEAPVADGTKDPEGDSRPLIQITDAVGGPELPFSEELLRKAVDSNIEIARLYSEVNEIKNRLRDRVRELTILHEVGKTVTSLLDVDQLLKAVVDSATTCFGTEYGSLMLLNRRGDGLIEKVVNGYGNDPLAQTDPEAGDQPILFQLAMKGDALLVNEDEGADILAKVRRQDERVRSLMVAPLTLQGAVVGVIVVYFLRGAGEGTRDKLRFLSALASHAAIALENARLVSRIEGFNRELEQKVRERTAELERAYDELKELDRLKDDFLSSMSHELLTPLTSIQSFSEILSGMAPEETKESGGEFIGIIHAESIRLTQRLRDLLDLSQIEAGQVDFQSEPVPLRALLDELLAEMAAEFKAKDIEVVVREEDRLPPADGDRRWLRRAIGALLSNAAKFSDEGGRVEILLELDDDEVLLRITDEGSGIAEEYHGVIFERFKQLGDLLTDKPTGIGLGLPLARTIVESHGGRIWVESAPGEGSTFSLGLPPADETADIRPKTSPMKMW